MLRRLFLAFSSILPVAANAQPAAVDDSATNLMVVLRESMGGKSRPSEALEYLGAGKVTLPNGTTVEVQSASYAYIGDMHVRFVFDGERTMPNAVPADLVRLGLSPDQALDLAIRNIRRVYGAPRAIPFTAGLMEVDGKSPDLISSYFLDKAFWSELERQHAGGLVVAVPKRGGIVFTPASDAQGVAKLHQGVGYLYRSSDRQRVSSALYLFKGGAWSVFQEPLR